MPEDKPELEKPEPRIIEVNEWFTPFTDYDALPYQTLPDGKPYRGFPNTSRAKDSYFQLANVGRFIVTLNYDQDLVDEADDFETYLLVLPASEKIINGLDLKKEQEQMETRPMFLEIEFLDKAHHDQTLPYNLETELPSGQIISAELKPIEGYDDELMVRPQTKEHWTINDQGFNDPQIPEVANIIGKIQLRFVPKE